MKDTLYTMKKSLLMYKSSLLPPEKPNRQKEIILPRENLLYEPFSTPKFEFAENCLKFNMNQKKNQVSEQIMENPNIKSDIEYKSDFMSINDIRFCDNNEQKANSKEREDLELYKKKILINFENESDNLFANKNNNEGCNIIYGNAIPTGHKEFLKINHSSESENTVKKDNPSLFSKNFQYMPCSIGKSKEETNSSPLESNHYIFSDANQLTISNNDQKEFFTLPPPILPKNKEEIENSNKLFLSPFSRLPIHTVSYDDCSLYKGELISSLRNGKGFYISSTGHAYIGHWLDDKKEGFGKEFTTKNDLIYAGYWKSNKKEGQGILFNRQSFENEHQKDDTAFHSKLSDYEQKYKNIEVIRKNPLLSSQKLSSWKKYEGEFTNNRKEGIGRMEYADGTFFVGRFEKDELIDGIINANGEEIKVRFENNKLLEV